MTIEDGRVFVLAFAGILALATLVARPALTRLWHARPDLRMDTVARLYAVQALFWASIGAAVITWLAVSWTQ